MKPDKNNSLITFWLILLVAAIAILSVSCKSTQTISEVNKETIKDSIRENINVKEQKEISKEINDSIVKSIPEIKTGSKDCDSICNIRVNEMLKQFEFYKRSGDNSYQILFDENKRLLIINANMKAQLSQKKDSISNKSNFKDNSKEKIIEVPVNILTKEQKINVWTGRSFWVLFLIWIAYRIFRMFN